MLIVKPKVLVAGATGVLGSRVLARLRAAGYPVRAIARSPERAKALAGLADEVVVADALDAAALKGACDGVAIVFSALGASVATQAGERRGYETIDRLANANLIAEAGAAGVTRFVYVSDFLQPGYAQTRYLRGHEAVVAELAASGIDHTVVRPTGFFSALEEFLPMARRGIIPLFGAGTVKTNPVHHDELAAACVEVIERGPREVSIGGPEVLTRRQIGEAAFAAWGKKPRFVSVPPGLALLLTMLLRPFIPRMSDLIEFVAKVSTHDCVAPAYGAATLAAYYRERAQGRDGAVVPGAGAERY